MKQFGKKDPKQTVLKYLMKLKAFPDTNTIEITADEFQEFNNFFLEVVESEGPELNCPLDNELIKEQRESHLGVYFCSEKCMSNYQMLLFNLMDRRIKIHFDYNWRRLVLYSPPIPYWGADKPIYPNLCWSCNLEKNFQESNMFHSDYIIYDRQKQQGFVTTTEITRPIEYSHVFPICDHCRGYLDIPYHRKGGDYGIRFRVYKINGFYVNDAISRDNGNCSYKDYDLLAEFSIKSRLFAWHFMIANPPKMHFADELIEMLVSFSTIDPDCAIDWLERQHFIDWSKQLPLFLKRRNE